MDVYILNSDYDAIALIDDAESVLWNKKYNEVGEAEIYIPCDNSMVELFLRGNYLYRYDDDMFCRIESVEIKTDVENGDYIIATAKDIKTILSGRIVRGTETNGITSPVVFSGRVCLFIKKLLTDNVIRSGSRQIPNFSIDESNFSEFTETIESSVVGNDLLQLIQTTCKAYNYGFRISFNLSTKTLKFGLYKGIDRASITSDYYVEFSPTFSNIISSEYKEDESNFKNVAVVGYKTESEDLAMLTVYHGTEPTGKNRREIYVDATNQNRSITYDELLNMFPNVQRSPTSGGDTGYYYIVVSSLTVKVATFEGKTTDGVYEEKITVTDYTFMLLIRYLGDAALAENTLTTEFSGTVDTIDTYEYKTDYNIGDVVKVINEYGIEAEARITEVMESDDNENGYQVEPKFEYI